MPEKVIINVLQSDITDTTASAVFNAPQNAGVFTDISDVPVYLYQSLKTIFTPTSDLTDFQSRFVPVYGQGYTNAEGDIAVIAQQREPLTFTGQGVYPDLPGAERAKVGIYIRFPAPVEAADFGRVKNTELRIRFLLDYNMRQKFQHEAPDLPVLESLDNSLYTNFCKCYWEGYATAENASEILTIYKVEYARVFAYSP